MLVVSLVEAGLIAGLVAAFAGLFRHVLRAHARERVQAAAERQRLVDQVCHLAGRPWTLPPRPEPDVEDDEPLLVWDPEQLAA